MQLCTGVSIADSPGVSIGVSVGIEELECKYGAANDLIVQLNACGAGQEFLRRVAALISYSVPINQIKLTGSISPNVRYIIFRTFSGPTIDIAPYVHMRKLAIIDTEFTLVECSRM